MKNYFTCVYQVGGYANFKWRQTESVRGYQAGCKLRDEVIRMGYPAILYRNDCLAEQGMPTEYTQPPQYQNLG